MLAGEVPQEEIEGRIILVGTSAPGLLDLRATPVDAAVPGIDIHAQLLEHLLTGKFLERPDYALALEQFVILVLGIMLAFALPRVSAKSLRSHWLSDHRARADGRLGSYFNTGASFSILRIQHWCWAFMTAVITFYTYHTAEAQRSQIRHAFGQYLAPALVEQLAQSPEKLVLGGEEREMTILFSDVRGFTDNLRILQGRPARPHLADEPAAHPAHQHDRRSRRNHRQIHRRCDHGILERTAGCSKTMNSKPALPLWP